MTGASNTSAYVFDARGISKRFRHAAIFGALESLDRGETMRFVNDHDPIPLLHQIQSRYGDQVAIAYVQRGPRAGGDRLLGHAGCRPGIRRGEGRRMRQRLGHELRMQRRLKPT